jgi:hypothetical protein
MDEQYGKGIRVANRCSAKKGGFLRCASCGHETFNEVKSQRNT